MVIQRKILMRVMGLLFLLVVCICLCISAFIVYEHRENSKAILKSELLFLADQLERLTLWDDRVAISSLLDEKVKSRAEIEYAFIERDGDPYVHTFSRGVPQGLLGLYGAHIDKPFTLEFQDGKGKILYDIVTSYNQGEAILHLGISRSSLDRHALNQFLTITALGAVILLIGALLSVGISNFTTQEVKNITAALRESEGRYRRLFDDSPVSLWEEDFSAVKNYIKRLQESGIEDLKKFFENHPEDLIRCASMVKINDVNQATLDLYQAGNKEEVMGGLITAHNREPSNGFLQELVAIGEGRTEFEMETVNKTCTGEEKHILRRVCAAAGHEETLAKILASMIDITDRKEAEQALEKARGELEQRVEERTGQLKKANEQLKRRIEAHERSQRELLSYQNRLRNLATELSVAEARERRNIATELHDRVAQSLFFTKMKLESVEEITEDPNFLCAVKEIGGLLEYNIDETRSLILGISPPVLHELGFEAALRWLATKTQNEHKISVDFEDDGRSKPLDDDLRDFLFRAVSELVTNVIKHANANKLCLSVKKINQAIQVNVKDDGVGIHSGIDSKATEKIGNFGLFSIRERVQSWGGSLELESLREKGTNAILSIPLKNPEAVYEGHVA